MRPDITGMRWNRLTAVEYSHTDDRRRACWLFRCDCGQEKVIPAVDVKRGNTQSCGCLARENSSKRSKKDITGERFGRLTAVKPTDERDVSSSVIWECLCDCGKTVRYSVAVLKQNRVQSCGCLYKESRSKCSAYRKDVHDGTSLSSLVSSKELRSDNSSGCTGVSWDQSIQMWRAYINFRKKRYNLGAFKDCDKASAARKRAEKALHDPIVMDEFNLLTEESRQKFVKYLSTATVRTAGRREKRYVAFAQSQCTLD